MAEKKAASLWKRCIQRFKLSKISRYEVQIRSRVLNVQLRSYKKKLQLCKMGVCERKNSHFIEMIFSGIINNGFTCFFRASIHASVHLQAEFGAGSDGVKRNTIQPFLSIF